MKNRFTGALMLVTWAHTSTRQAECSTICPIGVVLSLTNMVFRSTILKQRLRIMPDRIRQLPQPTNAYASRGGSAFFR